MRKRQVKKMKVKLIYGAPCSGKSTYVKENAGEHDVIWDYDSLLAACTNRTGQSSEPHPMASFVIDMRKILIDALQKRPGVENLYITCLWITDKLKSEVEGLDTEEIFIDTDKEECFRRLAEDSRRSDKGGWKKLINTWFKEHATEDTAQASTQPRRFWNWIRILDETTDKRVLYIEGMIADDSWWGDDAVTPKEFRNELNSGDGDIIVRINSEGGDVYAAAQIYTMLKEYGGKVTVKIDALAASAASVIAMAGDVVEISPVGSIMIHNPWTTAQGDSAEMTSTAKMLDAIKETILNAYEQKTHLPREQLARMMDEETTIPAQRAVDLGFADKLMFDADRQNNPKEFARQSVMNFAGRAFKVKLAAEKKSADKQGKKIAPKKFNFASFYRHKDLYSLLEESNNGIKRTV